MIRVVGLACGPETGGRTSAAVAAVVDGAVAAGAQGEMLELSQCALSDVAGVLDAADAVVFGSPVYRASYSGLLKTLLEATERGKWGEQTAPLQGKVAATVLTGASGHHFLAVNDLRDVLAGFFAVQVLSPGLYFDHSAYVERGVLTEDSAALAAAHGAALADLTTAVRGSTALRALTPQV